MNINYDRLSHFVEKIKNDKRIWFCKSYNIFTEGNNGESRICDKIRHERREKKKL